MNMNPQYEAIFNGVFSKFHQDFRDKVKAFCVENYPKAVKELLMQVEDEKGYYSAKFEYNFDGCVIANIDFEVKEKSVVISIDYKGTEYTVEKFDEFITVYKGKKRIYCDAGGPKCVYLEDKNFYDLEFFITFLYQTATDIEEDTIQRVG